VRSAISSTPLELFHNQHDSSGRIFGRRSEQKLGRMNPMYYKWVRVF